MHVCERDVVADQLDSYDRSSSMFSQVCYIVWDCLYFKPHSAFSDAQCVSSRIEKHGCSARCHVSQWKLTSEKLLGYAFPQRIARSHMAVSHLFQDKGEQKNRSLSNDFWLLEHGRPKQTKIGQNSLFQALLPSMIPCEP